jgi:hypothetical protein
VQQLLDAAFESASDRLLDRIALGCSGCSRCRA